MSVKVELTDNGGIGAAIEAAINRAVEGMEDAEVAVVAGGSRGASKNALIARVQQAWRRNPFYLDDRSRESIRFALRGLTAAQYSTRMRALALAGELMQNAIARNVEAQENADGTAFKPLSANYAAAKRRKFGFVVPILRATGDLLQGLRVRITTK